MKNVFLIILILATTIISCTEDSSSGDQTSSNGINGSYTKVLVAGHYLYGINGDQLTTLDISDKENVKEVDTQTLSFDIESIFHNEGVLFIGSSSRMYIFLIANNGIPELQSTSEYLSLDEDVTPCDPVVADKKFAYVTLSANLIGRCNRLVTTRELRIFNIEDLTNPQLISTYPMNNPKGLGIDGNTLFICDDDNGLVIFDVENREAPREIYHFSGFTSYDLIAKDGLLVVIAKDRVLQYDYSDLNNIRLLGTIEL